MPIAIRTGLTGPEAFARCVTTSSAQIRSRQTVIPIGRISQKDCARVATDSSASGRKSLSKCGRNATSVTALWPGAFGDELVAAYGGRCSCPRCPETNPAFLTLEHLNGAGKAHRAKVGSHAYTDLRRRGWPKDGYTLLCWNCNAMTRFGRTCPHMED